MNQGGVAERADRERGFEMFEGFTLSEPRYERKFLVSGLSTPEVEALVKCNPGLFREAFWKRFVNNLYLDYPDRRNYYDNVVGARQRQKVRIRWYGDLLGAIPKPTLEIKTKDGLVGWKRSFRLPSLRLEPGFRFQEWLERLRLSGLPSCLSTWLAGHEPSLVNRYGRRYFLSDDRNFRVTVDSEMRFGSVRKGTNSFLRWGCRCPDAVLELKYHSDHDLDAPGITSAFPFRVTRSSKYVIGIDTLSG